jgi:hypothetical protein
MTETTRQRAAKKTSNLRSKRMAMREMMGRLQLTVNEEKTRLCRVPESSFDFLGYTFGRCYSTKTGRAYIGTRPAKKSIAKVRLARDNQDETPATIRMRRFARVG